MEKPLAITNASPPADCSASDWAEHEMQLVIWDKNVLDHAKIRGASIPSVVDPEHTHKTLPLTS